MIKSIGYIVIGYLFMLLLPSYGFIIAGIFLGLFWYRDSWMKLTGIGLLSGFICWGGWSLWIDIQNESLLSSKISTLLSLPDPFYTVFITAVIGGLLGGLSVVTGASFRK